MRMGMELEFHYIPGADSIISGAITTTKLLIMKECSGKKMLMNE